MGDTCGCRRRSGRHNYVNGLCEPPETPVNSPLRGEQNVSGVPAQVLAARVADCLRRAKTYHVAENWPSTNRSMEQAEEWLDKLREALR